MTKTVSIGTPPIEIRLRRSALARRYSLRISNADGRVSLTLPRNASERAALAFAERQEGWLRTALHKRPETQVPTFEGSILFAGEETVIRAGEGRSVVLRDGALHVPGSPEVLTAKLRGFLKVQAREKLAEASFRHADQLGRDISRITLRDTRSRWGSCTRDGSLMYSWRLIMAPPDVLDYVAAHEVAHLIEMNHSSAFWKLVENLKPDYAQHRHWLKENGAHLHRYQFSP